MTKCSVITACLYDDADVLRRLSAERGVSVGELVRTYVAWGLETEGVEKPAKPRPQVAHPAPTGARRKEYRIDVLATRDGVALIDAAAKAIGKTRSAMMREAAEAEAKRILS